MATRSTIGIVRGYNDTTRIYCHWDGYVAHNGAILQKYYNTADKVERLLALGNLSCLGPEIKPDDPEDWDIHKQRDSRFCLTYTSRGEALEFCPPEQREEYNYTFYVDRGLWEVEATVGQKPGPAAEALGFGKLYATETKYLIDALSELHKEDWDMMSPANENDWGVTLEECISAAREAREPVNERNRQRYEAYSRAYAD